VQVALIIGNSEYTHLPCLRTPPCDAQSAAAGLLALDYKTVTLADLTLAEMQRVIDEYDQLLGTNGVYGRCMFMNPGVHDVCVAVFYFVGHGFETAGQCFLLPVDAPANDYTPADCIAVDTILQRMQQHRPALNLILLDMCRRCPPLVGRCVFLYNHGTVTTLAHSYKPPPPVHP
jgi:uncharacterized caspase-like protein